MFANCDEYKYPKGNFKCPLKPGYAEVYKSFKYQLLVQDHPIFAHKASISGPSVNNPGSDRINCYTKNSKNIEVIS